MIVRRRARVDANVHPSTGWTFKRGAKPKVIVGGRDPDGQLLSNARGEVRVRSGRSSRVGPGPGAMAGDKPYEIAVLDRVSGVDPRRPDPAPATLDTAADVRQGSSVSWRDGGRLHTGRVMAVRRRERVAVVRERGRRKPVTVPLDTLTIER